MYNPKLHFHFIGIGGAGMSGLAEVLVNLGFRVSGSDLKLNDACSRLARLGVEIFRGHAAANLHPDVSLVVYSSAVSPHNPEMLEAQERRLPIIRRAEVLAELMRLKYGVAVAGSHGKTSTTSMIAHVLEQGGLDPTVIIGGQVKSLDGRGGKLGKGQYLVAETDESDRSFLLLKPTLAVVTNIDAEHMEAYSSMHDLEGSFAQFVNAVPFYGLALLCVDDARVRSLAQGYQRRKMTFGVSPDADLRAVELTPERRGISFQVLQGQTSLGRFFIPMLGTHMATNSLAAIGVGLEFGLPVEGIRDSLAGFGGVRRRSEIIGEARGVTVMSDYGHHPAEIKATIEALRASYGADLAKLHVVFQPHRYSRTKNCFADFLGAFASCDNLVVTEIYAASEAPLEGISGESLCAAIQHPAKQFVAEPGDAVSGLVKQLNPGDVVLCMGAGSIGALPEQIVKALHA